MTDKRKIFLVVRNDIGNFKYDDGVELTEQFMDTVIRNILSKVPKGALTPKEKELQHLIISNFVTTAKLVFEEIKKVVD